MKELWAKIREALVSVLPITLVVYLVALLPHFTFTRGELVSFTVGAVLPVLGIGLFNMGADIAMTPMGTRMSSLHPALLMGILVVMAEPTIYVLNAQVEDVTGGYVKK